MKTKIRIKKLFLPIALQLIALVGLFVLAPCGVYADTYVIADSDSSTTYKDYTIPEIPGYPAGSIFSTNHLWVTVDDSSTPLTEGTDYNSTDVNYNEAFDIKLLGSQMQKWIGTSGTHTVYIGYCSRSGYNYNLLESVELDVTTGDVSTQEATSDVDTNDTSSADTGNSSSSTNSSSSSNSGTTSSTSSATSSASGGTSGSSTASVSLMFDPNEYIFIRGGELIAYFSLAYFVYWVIIMSATIMDYLLPSDFWLRLVTFNHRTMDDDKNLKDIVNELVIGLFIIAAYFSGAYLYLSYGLINVALTFVDAVSTMFPS